MPSIRRFGPLRPISFTANEMVARQIVDRLCRQPPIGCCGATTRCARSPAP
jgi:hypothetical protein